ncbi:MAG: four-carbon acid sugar kinase family protein [Haloferacaceae archaeon]
MDELPLAFYADDFTGATDALGALSVAGVRAVLFLDRPDPATVEREFPGVDALGMASQARSMTPAEMDDRLDPDFAALEAFDAAVLHYKVCSTFDSAPDVGSVGHAVDLLQRRFDSPFVPVAVGVPQLGRFVVFANHFATLDGETHRLDRHPVMRDHPVTPMDESDLRRHLGAQTDRPIGHLDVFDLEGPLAETRAALDEATRDDELVVLDTLTEDHLDAVGDLLWTEATEREGADPLVTVGSSGVEYALADRWAREGVVAGDPEFPDLDPVDRLVVMSGSASTVTDEQIERALADGFAGVRLDAARLVDPDEAAAERERVVRAATAALDRGESVVCYSVRGPDDPAIERTNERLADLDADEGVGKRLGEQQGRVLRSVLADADVDRACIAGGDTCSHAAPELDVYALEVVAPTAPGAPTCRGHARDPQFDGVELALKGGQLGQPDYFERVRRGE